MKLRHFVPEKVKNMTISQKLKLVSTLTLLVPMMLATISICIIYLTFFTNEYPQIVGMLETIDNTNYAYQAYQYINTQFKDQIINKNNDDIRELFLPSEDQEQGIVYIEVKKNSETIFHTTSSEKPAVFDELIKSIESDQDEVFSIIDGHIVFRTRIVHLNNEYVVNGHGNVRSFHLGDKTTGFYVDFLLTNLLFILIAFVAVLLLSKFLNKAVFDRVEYSLSVLSNGVEKISNGELDYRIKYRRKDEFQPICENFNQMAEELQKSVLQSQRDEKMRKEIIMSITHDICSPLTSIKAYVEGLESNIATTQESRKKYIEIINNKINLIERMINEMLLFSKLEFDDLSFVKENICLSDYLDCFINSKKDDYFHKKIKVNISKNEKCYIKGEKGLLLRVLENIFSNSRKYCDKEICLIDVSLENNGEFCTLKISDNGIGVTEDNLEHIFEIFYRSDRARQTNSGNGIGLSIVKNIITKFHSGSVYAENNDQGGLTIVIKIPTVKE